MSIIPCLHSPIKTTSAPARPFAEGLYLDLDAWLDEGRTPVPADATLTTEPSREDRVWAAQQPEPYTPPGTTVVARPSRRPIAVGVMFPAGTPAHEVDRAVLSMRPLD